MSARVAAGGRWSAVARVPAALILLAAALATGVAATASAAAPLPGTTVGVNLAPVLDETSIPLSRASAIVAAARRSGARVVRADALWEATERRAPTPLSDPIAPLAPGPVSGLTGLAPGAVPRHHHYSWAFDDRVATLLARQGIRWWPVIAYAPGWASRTRKLHAPPRRPADYAAYAGAFAARYGPRGGFWRAHPDLPALPVTTVEVWNEPDSRSFWAAPQDPAYYAQVYAAARDAVHLAAPGVRVLVGGLAHGDAFLRGLGAVQPRLSPDGIAIHGYARPDRLLARVRRLRAVARSAGLGEVPMPLTEFGWQRNRRGAPDYAPDRRRARYLTTAARALAASQCGVDALFAFTWSGGDGAYTAGYALDTGASRQALSRLLTRPPLLAPADPRRC